MLLDAGNEAQAHESIDVGEGQTPEAGTQENQNSWYYNDNVPGEGDMPEWFKGDKYGSISEQAKAYNELAQRFGGFTGAPNEYQVEIAEEYQDYLDPESPVLQDIMTLAKESNMSQDTLNKFLNVYAKSEAEMAKLAEEESKLTVQQEMQKLGDNANERLDNIKAWAMNTIGEEHYQALKGVVQTAEAVQAIEAMIKATKNAPIPQNIPQNESITRDKLNDMINAKNEHGQHRMSIDPEYRAKVQKMIKQFHGE